MTVARAWRRRLYGGVLGTALVPGTLLAILLAFAFAGGLARLGALGQAFSGPPIPSPAAGAQLARASRPLPAGAVAALSIAAGVRPGSAGSHPLLAAVPRVRAPRSGGAPQLTGSLPRPTSKAPTVPSSAPKPPGKQPGRPTHQTLADGIVNSASVITSQAPGPVGPAATQAIQTAGSTIDQILPPSSPPVP